MSDWEFGIVIIVIAGVLLFSVFGFFGFGQARGESTYTGYIVDTEIDRGYIFRTSTAHMKTHFRSSAVESFCLQTEELEQRAKELQAAEKKVRITYSRPLWVSPAQCDGGLSLIKDITVVKDR